MLFVSYLGLFHLWALVDRPLVVGSGVLGAVALSVGWVAADRAKYFVNRWDGLFHGIVILDIALEACLIPVHSGIGFYWCALGFGVVIGAYRLWADRQAAVV